MNSDQIRARFGNYDVDVIRQDQTSRLANLFSTDAQGRICRTLALTRFVTPVPEPLRDVDKTIRAGASIGATLRQAGWEIVKTDSAHLQVNAGLGFAALARETVNPTDALEIHVYTLSVQDERGAFDYAVIAEAYHPEHVPPLAGLPSFSSISSSLNLQQKRTVTALLEAMQ